MPTIAKDLGLRSIAIALDGLSLRQRVSANNIANIDTPGFKAQHVSFERHLQQALNDDSSGLPLHTTAPGHLRFQDTSSSELISVDHNQNTLRNDDNNVDIDLEMTTLAETALRFQALTQLAGKKFTLIKDMVRDAR